MNVRWTADAVTDLVRICDYIAKDRPGSAGSVASRIFEKIAALKEFPDRGRPGRVDRTRELVLQPLPFIAIYETELEVKILRILHAAQRWP
jgi:toxin ParE1/3/4